MTSHEYATKLKELAAFLEGVDEFPLPDYWDYHIESCGLEHFSYYGEKEAFLAGVRALGSVKKQADKRDFAVLAANGLLKLSVNREAVCRLVKPAQEAVYECEPLLSQAEEAQIA